MPTGVAKEARPTLDATSVWRADTNIYPAKEGAIEENKNFYIAEKVTGPRTNLKRHTTLLAGIVTDNRATLSSPPSTSRTVSKKRTGKGHEKVNRKRTIQGGSED